MCKSLLIFYVLILSFTSSFSQKKQTGQRKELVENQKSKSNKPSSDTLSRYTGIYQLTTDKSRTITISKENDHLVGEISGQATLPLVFKSTTKFNFEGVTDAACEFIIEKGRATKIIVFQNGKFIWKKIK